MMRLIELTVTAGAATSASALRPATVVAIIELQWIISLVESARRIHENVGRGCRDIP
ncbi:MAG TPA: hypothetical protein VIO32_03075 [Candidatus Baltobacteraceae bacterium]